MSPSKELDADLAKASPRIRTYVRALTVENARHERDLAKCEAQLTSSQNRVAALEEALVRFRGEEAYVKTLSDEELERLVNPRRKPIHRKKSAKR